MKPVEEPQHFFFGPTESLLFGSYHPPDTGPGRNRAVLLCYPIGDEYIRSHRAFRQLAGRLTKVGFPVMRFDYFGCGDSSGDDTDARLARWQADVAAAIAELKSRSGRQQIDIVGLRLGASLGLMAAEGRDEVGSVVMWEPVVNGEVYLKQLTESHQQKLWYFLSSPEQQASKNENEFLGFILNEAMANDLKAVDLLKIQQKPVSQVLLIEHQPETQLQGLQSHLEKLGVGVQYQQLEGPKMWRENPDKALVPFQILQAIVTWVAEEK